MPSGMPNQDAVEKITAPTNLSQGSSRANILIADGDEDYRELYSDPPITCNKQETLKTTVFRIIDSPLNLSVACPKASGLTAGRSRADRRSQGQTRTVGKRWLLNFRY